MFIAERFLASEERFKFPPEAWKGIAFNDRVVDWREIEPRIESEPNHQTDRINQSLLNTES